MAKGNMLQGLASGKMGDIVFYRANGQQISRVRVRRVGNPRTNKQQIQRAIMATVMQAYSAGKEIFDHSFQGKKVGAGNQAEFLRLNALNLRNTIAADFDLGRVDADAAARVVAPKSLYPVINEYIISRGNYPQKYFSFVTDDEEDGGNTRIVPAEFVEGETVGQYAQRVGLVPGDLYTIVTYGSEEFNPVFEVAGVTSSFGKQFEGAFGYVRFQVKEDVLTNQTAMAASLPLATFFDITASENMTAPTWTTITDGIIAENVGPTGYLGGGVAVGIIRSRLDQDLRSDSKMIVLTGERAAGITSNYALQAWTQGTTEIGNSELILEGGDPFQ